MPGTVHAAMVASRACQKGNAATALPIVPAVSIPGRDPVMPGIAPQADSAIVTSAISTKNTTTILSTRDRTRSGSRASG